VNATPVQLNAAFRAMVATVPNRDRLTRHLAENRLEAVSAEISQTLNGLLQTAEDFLYGYPGGVPWTKEFGTEYLHYLRTSHPWVDDATLETIMTWSQWLCWHEGLDASPKR
jgi:hypothetical protein